MNASLLQFSWSGQVGINTAPPANKVLCVILGVNVVHLRVFLWLQMRHSIHRDHLCYECKAEIRGQRPLERKQLLLRARHSTTMQKGDCRHEHKILHSKNAIIITKCKMATVATHKHGRLHCKKAIVATSIKYHSAKRRLSPQTSMHYYNAKKQFFLLHTSKNNNCSCSERLHRSVQTLLAGKFGWSPIPTIWMHAFSKRD